MTAIAAAALLLTVGAAACGSVPAASPRAAGRHEAPGRPSAGLAQTTAAVISAQLVSLALSSPQRGYGLFEVERGARCEALAARTLDGGARFGRPSQVTSWNCNDLAPVTSLAVDSAGDVFAYGPELFIAGNVPGRFVGSPQRGTVLSVAAVHRSVWMLLERCHGSSPARCALDLTESVNGGRSWHQAESQPSGEANGGFLLRTGSASGYVLAGPEVNNTGKADSATLWRTSDAGLTWSAYRVPCGQDALSAVLARAPGGELVAVCAGEPSAGSEGKTTTLSVNGGRSWTKPAGCPLLSPCPGDAVLLAGYVSQVAAVTARTIYLIGNRGPLLVSSDGGRHWRQVSQAIGAWVGGVAQVVFFGRSDGVVVGNSLTTGVVQIWHTADGGRRWSRPVVPRLG
jgi:hypothetical protein